MNATASPAPAPGLTFGEKVVVLAGGIIAAMALTVLNPVLPAIEDELAHNATDRMLVKQLFGAVTLAMVVGAPLGGFLVDRVGMRRLLLVASLIYAIAGSAGILLSSLPWLLVTRLFVGASAACIQVMSLTLISTRLDATGRAKWMGLHISTAIFCSLVIFPVAGFLGDISWRLPFLIYLFGLVVFGALLFSRDRDTKQAEPAETSKEPAKEDESIMRWMPWHYVIMSLFIGSITFLPTIYTPYLFVERAGLSPSQMSLIFTGSALIGGITALLYGKARQYLSVHVTYLFCFSFAAIGMGVLALTENLVIMLVGFIIYSLGNSWFVANVMTSLGGKVKNHQQARAAGLVKAGHFLSTPIMVILVAPYAERFGAVSVMMVAGTMSAFILVLMIGRMITLGRSSLAVESMSPAPTH
jgi:MFS family permease